MTARPPTPQQRQHLATWLQSLADELTRTQAAETMKAIAQAVDGTPYPNRTSTVPSQPHNRTDTDGTPIRPDTPTEAKALNPDQIGQQSTALLDDLDQLETLTRSIVRRLWAWRPDRAVASCPRCGNAFERGYTRCQRVTDGIQCGSSETHTRSCMACGRIMAPGEPLRAGRCHRDYMFWRRNGRDRIHTEALELDDTVLISDEGAAHA